MQASAAASPALLARVAAVFGPTRIAALPAVTPTGDHSAAFSGLHEQIAGAPVVVFPAVAPHCLDGFFRLRLIQTLAGSGPEPALSVIVLKPGTGSETLAGGFAERFGTSWPFEKCVFLAEAADSAALSQQIGLPVLSADALRQPIDMLHSRATADQKIAVQTQFPWGRCGSTTLFENQIEGLVKDGFLTIRLFTDANYRTGPTLDGRLAKVIPENATRFGAHIDSAALPEGAPMFIDSPDPEQDWAAWLALTASCRIPDAAVSRGARMAASAIANHLDTLGAALHLAPSARLLFDVHDDRAEAIREWMSRDGNPAGEAEAVVTVVAAVQARLLAIPDICTHVSTTEQDKLGGFSRRSAIVLPRIHPNPRPAQEPRFDLLLFGDEHVFNVESVQWFLNDVWRPYLQVQSVSVAIAGRVGQKIDTAGAADLLHVLGFVDDLEALRAACRLTVVPDRAGTGISIKLLTTVEAEHPLAVTTIGLRGLEPAIAGLLPGIDDAAAMAEDIGALLRDPHRLAGRRALVQDVRRAIGRSRDYAALLRDLPEPSPAVLADRTARWAEIVAPAAGLEDDPIVFGDDTVFSLSGSAQDTRVLLSGWHAAEPWGRWTDGAEACLRLPLAQPAQEPLRIEVDLMSPQADSVLTADIDGYALPAVTLKAGVTSFDLPPEVTDGKSSLTLTLRTSITNCPALSGDSPDDRILGLGVKTIRLLAVPIRYIEPGLYQTVAAGAVPPGLLASGWHGAEDWGCWSNGGLAELQLIFRVPLSGEHLLRMDLVRPLLAPTVGITVNDIDLGARPLNDGLNEWMLPQICVDGHRVMTVRLRLHPPVRPMDVMDSDDDRLLGTAIRSIGVFPADGD